MIPVVGRRESRKKSASNLPGDQNKGMGEKREEKFGVANWNFTRKSGLKQWGEKRKRRVNRETGISVLEPNGKPRTGGETGTGQEFLGAGNSRGRGREADMK